MHYGKVIAGTLQRGRYRHRHHRRGAPQGHHAGPTPPPICCEAALQKVLGDHVHQAGSLVEPDRLRFDFTHFSAITPEELISRSSELVNDAILEGYPVATEVMPIEEAKKEGAMALFGEKYGDTVRVVDMGDCLHGVLRRHPSGPTPPRSAPSASSSEGSVASGVRRIEATVGRAEPGAP